MTLTTATLLKLALRSLNYVTGYLYGCLGSLSGTTNAIGYFAFDITNNKRGIYYMNEGATNMECLGSHMDSSGLLHVIFN